MANVTSINGTVSTSPNNNSETATSNGSVPLTTPKTDFVTTDAASSLSPSTIAESSTTVHTNHSAGASSIHNTATTTTSISNSFGSISEESTSDLTESPTYLAQTSTDFSPSAGGGGEVDTTSDYYTTAIVLTILILLLLAGVAILLYIRYRRKIRWCKPKNEHKEPSASDNGFATHHVTNEVELKVGKGASSLRQSDEAPPTSDGSKDQRTNSDRPIEALSAVNQSKKGSPTSNDSSKPPPIADRPTETPPPRHKRKAKTTSCQLAYVPPPADEDFMDCIKRHQENLILYQKEFDCLPDGSIKSSSVARVQQNIVKNRYVNVLPYDCNRVVLPKKSEDDSDFINASFIDGAVKKNAYISTQGPLTSTLPDFWSMIWSNNSNRILMLTNLEESIRGVKNVKTSKCTQYWPSTIGQSSTYGDIEVKFLQESVELNWTVRTLAVKKEGDETVRTILQYHYTTWPDQDVPHTSTAILKFHRVALPSTDTDDSSGPVIVHCSAGVGRTGTLIAIDILAEKWKATQPRCDVFKCVQNLRQQRMSMVQSVRQYMFIHHSLIQEFRIGVSVEQTPEEMLEHRHTTEELQEQFKILEATSVISIPHCSVSKSKSKKNRSSTILPSNSLIRFLKQVKEDDNVYINAVPVNGFRESNAFFVTQMPLNDTINDFWRLVNDNSCHAIVMLNSSFNDDERYWPLADDVMKTKSFHIKRTGSGNGLSRDGLVTTDLEVQFNGTYKKNDDSSSEDDESSCDDSVGRRSGSQDLIEGFDPSDPNQSDPHRWRPVLHLRVADWPETQLLPSDPSILLDLYEQVTQLRARHPKGCILIQCMYGADRSGLFCAIVNILDRLTDQGTIGVFDAVKLIKERRQQFVPDFEHYDYLHQLVNIYLNKRKEKKTKDEDVSREGLVTKQEKEPTGQDLTKRDKQPSVAEEVTRDQKRPEDQRTTKDRKVEPEQGTRHKEPGSVAVTQGDAIPSKEGKVTQDAKELRDIAIIQQTKEKGSIQDSKEPQGKGITEAAKEVKEKEIAPDTKKAQEKGIIQGDTEQRENEIIQKPKETGNTQASKEPQGKGPTEASKELKEKEIAPSAKETQEKGINQGANKLTGNEIIQKPQETGNTQSSKESQKTGTAETAKELKEKEIALDAKKAQEKGIIQGANEQKGNEIIQKPQETGNTQDSKEPQGKGTTEAAKELKEKEIAPDAKESQEKGRALGTKETQERGTSQGVTNTKENGITKESQEKRSIDDHLSQEERVTKC